MKSPPKDALAAFDAVRAALQAAGVDLGEESRGAALWSMTGEATPTARAGAARSDPARPWATLAAAVIAQPNLPDASSMLDALTFDPRYDDARCRLTTGEDPTCAVLHGISGDDDLEHTELIVGWRRDGAYHRLYADAVASEAGLATSEDLARLVFETVGLDWPHGWRVRALAAGEDEEERDEEEDDAPVTLRASASCSFDEVVSALQQRCTLTQAHDAPSWPHLSAERVSRSAALSLDARVRIDVLEVESTPPPSIEQMLRARTHAGVADALDTEGLDAIELAAGPDGVAVAFFQSSGGIADVARRHDDGVLYVRVSTDGYADDAIPLTQARGWVVEALRLEITRWIAHDPDER